MLEGARVPTAKPGVLLRLRNLLSELSGAYRLVALARGTIIAPSARVKTPSRFQAAHGVKLQRGAIVHCGGKVWCDWQGGVRIGRDSVIGPYCVLYGAGGIELGEHVHLGPGAMVMTQSGEHDARRFTADPTYRLASVSIGDGSWIGAGAVILAGSTLGRGVTVAPNSVVAGGTVPDFAMVAGNPARTLRINEVPA